MSGVDRISMLPDAILVHILSFLPLKTVVTATSTLSKRWRDLWQSIPIVDLDDSPFQLQGKLDRFVPFAFAVILSRDATLPILNFRLKYRSANVASSEVNLWLKTAIQRKVETIELSPYFYSHVKLPTAILTCSSLVVLKLKNLIVDRISTVQLPLLKTLHIDLVRFTNGEYLEMILSGCPNIHHLQIKGLELQQSFIPLGVTFPNLIHVELFLYQCKWIWIVRLLNNSPLLQVLDVGGDKLTRPMILPDPPYPKTVPGCLSSHLRACTLRNFLGHRADIRFAIYVLQNARVLNKMTICCQNPREEGDKYQILKKISKKSGPKIGPESNQPASMGPILMSWLLIPTLRCCNCIFTLTIRVPGEPFLATAWSRTALGV
ncbi:hypothetical protein PIB30_074500 [Stylosanthes scabra]|uniref:F-box domain-containing protein n=1 Tax=Stylosanthes scabra TaxID=79078 RepID=A0ABU6VP51_9FABA|nr:hypothetical protein [Stylosanthes scabra]